MTAPLPKSFNEVAQLDNTADNPVPYEEDVLKIYRLLFFVILTAACRCTSLAPNADLLRIEQEARSEEAMLEGLDLCGVVVNNPNGPASWYKAWKVPSASKVIVPLLEEQGALRPFSEAGSQKGLSGCRRLTVSIARSPKSDAAWQELRYHIELEDKTGRLESGFLVSREEVGRLEGSAALTEAFRVGAVRIVAKLAAWQWEEGLWKDNTAKVLSENANH